MAKIQALLESSTLPLPRHEIKCYGRQITVECIARESAAKWAQLLGKFAKVRGMIKSEVYVKGTMYTGSPRTVSPGDRAMDAYDYANAMMERRKEK